MQTIKLKYLFLFIILWGTSLHGWSQKVIKIIGADTITQYENLPGHTILKGNVIFEHEGARLYCDSAYLKEKESLLKAYSKVQINQGDTINLFGDSLYFYGKTKYAKIRGHVRFRDREYKLVTDSLDFDMEKSYAFYRNGATITHVKQNQTIKSRVGYYYGNSRSLYFRDSVSIKAPKYTVFSDTLEYSIRQGRTVFYGPTTIYTDSLEIYCEDGYYNTEKEEGRFKKNAYFVSGSQRISGDSLYYNQRTKIGIGKGHVAVIDTAEKMQFMGQYAELYENENRTMITDDAIALQFDGSDTLYIRADTLKRWKDTSVNQEHMWAYYDVRIFSKDLNGLCDSASYSDKDSLLHLYKDPILWSQDAQITGDSIKVKRAKKDIDRIWIRHNSLLVRPADSITNEYFNQISGKFMTAYFDSSKLEKVYVRQNAQTIYFTVDDSLKYSGMNESKSSEIHMYMKGNQIERAVMHTEPTGTYYPFNKIPTNADRMENFEWHIKRKPKRVLDLYADTNNYFVAPPIHHFENIQARNHWKRFHKVIDRDFQPWKDTTLEFQTDSIQHYFSDSILIDSADYISPDSSQYIFIINGVDSINVHLPKDSLEISILGINTDQIQNIIWEDKNTLLIFGITHNKEQKYPTQWRMNFLNSTSQISISKKASKAIRKKYHFYRPKK